MRIETVVSRAKFEAEVRQLHEQAETLRRRGCWVQRAVYPEVDVVFVPREPLKLTLWVQPSTTFIVRPKSAQAAPGTATVFALAGRAFGIRVRMDDYDQRAPSVTFRDPWTWEVLRYGELPWASTLDEKGNAQRVLLDEHPVTKLPFLCLRGTREYHEHPQHDGDDWMLLRGNWGIFDLLSLVWLTCVQQAYPHFILLPPQVGLQWEAQASQSRK